MILYALLSCDQTEQALQICHSVSLRTIPVMLILLHKLALSYKHLVAFFNSKQLINELKITYIAAYNAILPIRITAQNLPSLFVELFPVEQSRQTVM